MRRSVAILLLALSALLLTPSAATAASDRASVDGYLRAVARHTGSPGVYVDPAVLRGGRITASEVATIRVRAAAQPSRLHLFVLPASRLTLSSGGVGPAHLASSPRAMIGRLHHLVGKPGTYAVITAAPTRAAGQSFYAYQWPGGGRVYDTGSAVRGAIACCAPKYGPMLLRFVALSAQPLPATKPGHVTHGNHHTPHVSHGFTATGSSGGIGGAGPFVLVALLFGVVAVGATVARAARSSGGTTSGGGPQAPPASVDDLRAPLGEEIEQVRQQISAVDTAPTAGATTPDPAASQIAAARQSLDLAHTRMTTMAQPADAQAVAAALADARYQVAAAGAVRDGRPVPDRTPPCFVDPRHGPSVTTGIYPPSGLTAPVPLCAACAASLAAGTAPAARSFYVGGLRMYPWMPYGAAWWYLNGYWGGQPFLQQMAHHQAFLHGNFDHPGRGGPGRGPDSGGGSGFGGGHHGGGGIGGGGGGGHHGGGGFGGGGHGGGGFGGGHGGGGGFGGGHGGGGGFGGGHGGGGFGGGGGHGGGGGGGGGGHGH